MTRLRLTLACDTHDRTLPLLDGRVRPDGIDLTYLPLQFVETLWRQLQFAEFEVSEMSLSAYLMELANGKPRFVGLPVFVVRLFMRGLIYVRADAGIERPEDLKGRRVGIPEYHMTAGLFLRGLLSDDHGVRAEDIEWVQGGLIEPGRKERVHLDLPPQISVTPVTDRTIDQMLVDGELDAIMGMPSQRFHAGDPRVRRLFPDPRAADLEAFHRTGMRPINHLVVVRKDVYNAHPWVMRNLYQAFADANQIGVDKLTSWKGGASSMLPFFNYDLEDTLTGYGPDLSPYGVEANRATLEAAVRYSYEQGLSARQLTVDELFPPNLAASHV